MTDEEVKGPISFWEYKEQESNLILPEHDDDDDKFSLQFFETFSDIRNSEILTLGAELFDAD